MEKLSILVPVYNEERTVAKVLDEVLKTDVKGVQKEIIVVNDGSTDSTKNVLAKYGKKKVKGLKIIHHKINRGKGAAIRTAISHASGNILLIQDADLEYNPKEYTKLLEPIFDGEAKVVYGSRIKAIEKNLGRMYITHYLGNKILSLATSILFGQWISDMETGYKVFKKEVVKGLQFRSKRFDIEPEITAKIIRRGYKIREVPIGFEGRTFKDGKKITWRDGVVALLTLIKYRFVD